MKLCFNQATTMKHSTLEKDLESCEKHGYHLIEIRLDKLRDYLTRHTLKDLKEYFSTHKIKPFAFNALEFISFRDEKGNQEIWDTLTFLCECGAVIDCRKIVVVPTFDVGDDKTVPMIREETVRQLRRLADKAKEYEVKLAFEFVGYPNCSVNTFNQAYDIVEATGRDNVGIVLDCFHFYSMGSRIEDISKAKGENIFIFHIDDSEDLPTGAARDDKRLWPGDGIVPLDGILDGLKKIGYQDMVSVELFRPEYYELPIDDCIRIAKEKTVAVVSSYFDIEA